MSTSISSGAFETTGRPLDQIDVWYWRTRNGALSVRAHRALAICFATGVLRPIIGRTAANTISTNDEVTVSQRPSANDRQPITDRIRCRAQNLIVSGWSYDGFSIALCPQPDQCRCGHAGGVHKSCRTFWRPIPAKLIAHIVSSRRRVVLTTHLANMNTCTRRRECTNTCSINHRNASNDLCETNDATG